MNKKHLQCVNLIKTTEYLKSINYNGSIENYIQEVSTKEISELTNVEKRYITRI